MEKLSIFKIEDASTDEYNAVRVELFPGEDPEDAVVSFKKIVFENATPMLYRRLSKKLADADEWEADDELSDCIVVTGDAQRVSIPHHYRFERNKKGQLVKATPERVVKYVKVVAFKGGSVEEEVQRYKEQVPEDCWIEEEEAE